MPTLMEVIEFLDNTGDIMARRVPQDGSCEIKWGAQLTVRESQTAVFFRDGKALDVFGPGRYVLQTQNLPDARRQLKFPVVLYSICVHKSSGVSVCCCCRAV